MLPAERGICTQLLELPAVESLRVGRLGTFRFPAGFYPYDGSALGPGGLASRLQRHCQGHREQYWHIDWLRPAVRLQRIWARATRERRVCTWVAAALTLPTASVPVPRFDASDCRCPAHLLHYHLRPEIGAYAAALGSPACSLQVPECRWSNEEGPSVRVAGNGERG